jgi:hypothetical protein
MMANINGRMDAPVKGAPAVIDKKQDESVKHNADGSIFKDNLDGTGRVHFRADGGIDVTSGLGPNAKTRHIETDYKDGKDAYSNATNAEMGINDPTHK